MKELNDEKCNKQKTGGQAAAGDDTNAANGGAQMANKVSATFFDQIIYGTDHVFTPTQFVGEL